MQALRNQGVDELHIKYWKKSEIEMHVKEPSVVNNFGGLHYGVLYNHIAVLGQ